MRSLSAVEPWYVYKGCHWRRRRCFNASHTHAVQGPHHISQPATTISRDREKRWNKQSRVDDDIISARSALIHANSEDYRLSDRDDAVLRTPLTESVHDRVRLVLNLRGRSTCRLKNTKSKIQYLLLHSFDHHRFLPLLGIFIRPFVHESDLLFDDMYIRSVRVRKCTYSTSSRAYE